MAGSDSAMLAKTHVKRKSRQVISQDYPQSQEEVPVEGNGQKKIKLCKTWENLDLILTLQSKEVHLQEKIKASFDFARLEASEGDGRLQPVSFSRALRHVFDWTQSLLMFSDRNKKNSDFLDPSLDYRCWSVIKLCSEKFLGRACPNLFRAVTPVLKQALLLLDENFLLQGVYFELLFENVLQCFSSLVAVNSRTFYNVSLDLWISCASDVLNIVSRVSCREEQGSSMAKVLLNLSALLLEHFSNFLRFHTNPKNIFRIFVERLLKQLFELLVLLQLRAKDSCEQFTGMLKIVEDVLLNGLFHPAHISGFLSSKSSTAGQVEKTIESKESYHRHLFRKLEKIIGERNVATLGGLSCLLRLFASKAKGQQSPSLSFRGRQALKKNNNAISVDAQETIVPLFEMFMQFMKPLVQECKHCAEKELSIISEASENRLTELHCMLRSVNETLQSFIQEKIYARTEETAEEKHYCFLKEIHDAFYSISIKLQFFWLSEGQTGDEVKKILPLIAKEIIVGVGSFLEIEYRVFGDDLITIWLMLLSYLSFTDTKPCSLLISSILNVGCKLINVYSELRQVNIPLFALCKAVRFLINNNNNNTNVTLTGEYKVYSSTFLSSQRLLKAVQVLLSSQNFRLTIINSINSMPEGQAGNCIRQLNLDITDALEWIKQNSFSVDRKSLSEAKKTNISMLDMDIQAEVLGKILSEIYATVLESLSITSTNSILIGNSLKSLIKTLSLILGCFLQAQSSNVNDFVFSITGRNLPNSEFIECGNSSQAELQSVCWLFLFFFRLYASARSLYRQSISLMPPDISHKASEALGDLFTASCYMDWVERPEKMDGGYFSWVAKSSLSLPEVIKIISEDYLSSSFAGYAPLVYMLLVITVQRLSDLNKLIKAFESFHKKDASVVQMQLQGDTFARRSKKQWKQLIAGSRKEAVELTNFMVGHLSLFDSMDPHGQFDGDGKADFAYEAQWDCGISSLNEKSLPVAVWWLLCQSIDVWCVHFTKKHIKIFFSYLFLYSLPYPSNQKDYGKKKGSICHNVTLHHISLHFLEDTTSYEEMMTYTNVSARYCHVLKKLASPILLRTAPSNLDLGSLPNWVELLNVLEKGPVFINADHQLVLNDSSLSGSVSALPRMICLEHRMSPRFSSFSVELKACENLLNLFCKMPRFYGNTKSFLRYATYMLNIERLLVSNLLNPPDDTLSYEPFQLLKLFVSCRRAMKSLVMGFNKNSGARGLSPICAVFNCSSSILWLFKSVYKVAELSTAYFGEKDSNLVQDMIYFLIDHTSYVFLKISEAKVNAAFLFLLKNTVNKVHISQNRHSLNGNDCTPKSFEPCYDWEHVERIAETLKEHAEEFLVAVKSCDSVKLDTFCNTPAWSKFSCVISCFQALLLGLTSASDSLVLEMPIENRKISNLMLSCVSKLSSNIEVFENLLNLCLNVLIFGDSQVTEDISIANYDSSVSDCVERTMKLFTPIDMTKISCCQTEHVKRDDATVRIKINSFESSFGSSNEKDEPETSTARKQRSQASHLKLAIDFFHIVNKIDLEKNKIASGSLVQSLLEDTSLQAAFILRQLFITSAAILRIKCIPSRGRHLKNQPYNGWSILCSTVNFYGASCLIFQGFSEMICQPCLLSFAWLDGVLTFFDAVWNLFCFVNLDVSKYVYTHLIDLYLKAMGKCISLQGKTSTLFSRDIESDAKLLEPQNEISWNSWRFLGHGKHGFSNFKTKLRLSFKKYITIPSDVYLKTVIWVIEEKLAGVRADYPAIYQLITGNVNGGAVSSDSAASIECFELILDCFPGQNQYLRESMPNLVGAIINIVLHLQNSSIFYTENLFSDKSMVDTNAGAVIRMCIEVLTKVVGRRSFHMGPCYVSQYFHIPTVLFVEFYKLSSSCVINSSSIFSCNEEKTCLSGRKLHMVDHQFFVELYTSCCRLMCSAIKHRKSETVRCIHLLEESISTLLSCLVAVDSNIAKKEGCFSLNLGEALKCANFLRRIYEEIRQQKDALGKYSSLLLSNYISIYSGCGPYKAGIKREIDEAIRPGVYSLIDICTRADLQQLHNLLSEGPCRSTLSILLHDYQQNFQYEGKI